jgi:CHAT domain/Translocon-associated protein beta (TRAPB)
MIEVSVKPSHLVAGRQTRLAVVFVNTSQGPCSDVVCRLELPSGLSLLDGRSKVEISSIPPGGAHTHEITVEASKSGEFELTSVGFSYRDQYGVSADGVDLRWKLFVAPGSDRPTSPMPTPRLAVRVEDATGRLSVGAWSKLQILVKNASDVILDDVVMELTGPMRVNGSRSRLPRLHPGVTARFTFDVIADEGGQVPVGSRTTFTYTDRLGSIRQARQDEGLQVEAAAHNETPGSAKEPGETILYLTASPKDPDLAWLPLRSDLEMRKVKERLHLSRHRFEYRIEPCPAARWDDVSQALVDYEPQVVHFSGHGDRDGNLLLEDDAGGVSLTTPEGLARLFGLHRSTIRCVIVNACHSERLARAMAENVDHVVGMRCEIGDEAAIQFSVGFYMALFAGQPVSAAFERGVAHIQGPETTKLEYQTPLLLSAR